MVSNNTNGDFQKMINRRFLREYAFYLQAELDAYVCPVDGVNLLRHGMRVSASSTETIVTVEFVHQTRFESWVEDSTALGFTVFRDANDRAIAYQFTDDLPSTRKLGIHLDKGEHGEFILHICRQSGPHDWSNVQAWEDSNNAIALLLAQRGSTP